MFYLQKAFLNIRRHKIKSFLTVLVCAFFVMFVFIYIGSLQSNMRQLKELPDAVPVYARVSNLNGTQYDGITISDMRIDGIEASPHVSELSYTVKLWAASKRIAEDEVQYLQSGELNFPFALGTNSLSTFPSLSAEDVVFIDGAGPEAFEGDEAVCIISDIEMQELGFAPGEVIWVTPFYITYPNDTAAYQCNWLSEEQVKIIGSYSETWNKEGSVDPMQIIFPAKWLRKLHDQKGIMFNASSARFRVSDPLKLNEFKVDMKELMLMSVISQSEYSPRGIALTVMDETFIKAAARLTDNINLMWIFMPFICLIIGLSGFVASYLLMNGRKPEIAIMRSLGMSRESCTGLLFLENAALNLLGGALGFLFAAPLIAINATLAGAVIALFFACYMAGTATALVILGRLSVMSVLAALE